jgi:uncharacterized protein with HEPN domain
MPFRDAESHLRDILESIGHIEQFIVGMDFDSYRGDEKTKAAVERKIQILTEAVIRLETDGPDEYPDIDWKGYRGLGNFLRHSYHRIDDQIVWNTVKEDIPSLKGIVEKALRVSDPKPQDEKLDRG